MIDLFSLKDEKASTLKTIYANSAIGHRYSVVNDFTSDRESWEFLGKEYPEKIPGMRQRNDFYKKHAPQLAHEAALKALMAWGGDPKEITHVISISCTGVLAPGIEFRLIESLNLNPSIMRLGINFMGCYGAFKGLQVATAFANQDPSHRILIVCTELCSLHLHSNSDMDTLLANCIFSDGIAAAIVGNSPRSYEKPLFSIIQHKSVALDKTLDKMTWEAGDHGFFMHLSTYVPALIKRHVKNFIDPLIHSYTTVSECEWAIHPGGKSILHAIERGLNLDKSQTTASWETLWNYGNMSSATFLFILELLAQKKIQKEWITGIGFGPGLSMEGILLHNECNT